jgi:hypothetical protein
MLSSVLHAKLASLSVTSSVFLFMAVSYYLFERHYKNALNATDVMIQKEYKLKEEIKQ